MPKQKIDWINLKQEFFDSKYLELKPFMDEKWIKYTKTNKKLIIGWAKEKREYKKQQTKELLEKQTEVKIDYAKRREQKVQEAIDWIIDDIIKRVKNTDNRKERVTYLEKLKEDIGEGKKMILDVNNTSHERTEEDKEILQSIADRLWLDWKMLV